MQETFFMLHYDLQMKAYRYALLVFEAIEPDCVILYGSVARNQDGPDSDIDILVIGGNLEPNWFTRLTQLSRLVNGNGPIEAIGYTRAEWDSMMKDKHVTVLEALNDGIPLHGKDLFAQWRSEFEHWQTLGLRQMPACWILPPVLQSA